MILPPEFWITRMALLMALIFSPWLLSRLILGTRDLTSHILLWGPLLVGVNILVPVTLHLSGVSITPLSLSAGHFLLFAAVVPLLFIFKIRILPPSTDLDIRWIILAGAMALALLPFTHLAGIDTYKWQDLASAVGVEQSIPWLAHPLALFGYAPRSYPSAYPLLLASIQILGSTGVDWGFYLASILTAWIALGTSWALGCALWPDQRREAFLFSLFYLLAPVFIRYTHWATGRGLFLALFPGFLWFCLGPSRGLRRWLGLLGLGLLLLLSHKVSLVAIPLCLFLLTVSKFIKPFRSRAVLLVLGGGILGLGWLFSGAHPDLASGLQPLRQLMVRFGILSVLLIPGIAVLRQAPTTPPERFLFWGLVLTLPMACAGEMYGTLPALPFVVWVAVVGYARGDGLPRQLRFWLQNGALTCLILGAGTILLWRSLNAIPRDLYDAAQFLEQHDPLGPLRIEAPGMARRQIQAYVTGCPRFEKPVSIATQASLQPWPSFSGNGSSLYTDAIRYLRQWILLDIPDFTWYGKNPRVYYFTINGQGTVPPGQSLLYDHNGIRIFGP